MVVRIVRRSSKPVHSWHLCYNTLIMRRPDKDKTVRQSKFLSLILRHKPYVVGIALDEAGWVDIDILLAALIEHNSPITRDELNVLVEQNSKKRFAISPDGKRIRASQGHSVEVQLNYESKIPPTVLYHGTATKNLDAIKADGLLKMKRHHVHLSVDQKTAEETGKRYGQPVVITVQSLAMKLDGFAFYESANGVWLTDHVPPKYLSFA